MFAALEIGESSSGEIFLIVILLLVLFLLVSIVSKSRAGRGDRRYVVISRNGIAEAKESESNISIIIMILVLIAIWIAT